MIKHTTKLNNVAGIPLCVPFFLLWLFKPMQTKCTSNADNSTCIQYRLLTKMEYIWVTIMRYIKTNLFFFYLVMKYIDMFPKGNLSGCLPQTCLPQTKKGAWWING